MMFRILGTSRLVRLIAIEGRFALIDDAGQLRSIARKKLSKPC
jgi:hypothetical protein